MNILFKEIMGWLIILSEKFRKSKHYIGIKESDVTQANYFYIYVQESSI